MVQRIFFFFFFAPMEDGSVGKVRALRLTHLSLNFAANNPPLVGIHKGWPVDLNLSACPKAGVT